MQETTAALARHLARRLRGPLPGPAAQRRFAPLPLIEGWSPDQTPETARRAAVLVLLYPGSEGPTIPLTVRPVTLPTHGGQISLPGGALDPDESPEAAAVREAEEEIGVAPHTIQLLGALSTLWIPISNYVLTPIIGVTNAVPEFKLHLGEVAALIEVPVSVLLDHTTVQWAHRTRGGTRIDYPYYKVGGQAVWGATAMVLSEFAALVDDHHADHT